jgi:hypothetical protein
VGNLGRPFLLTRAKPGPRNHAERFKIAADDCTIVLAETRPSSSKLITKKAHFRLAQSYRGLGELEKTIVEFDKYQELNGGSSPMEERLRTKVRGGRQTAVGSAPNPASGTRSMRYEVRSLYDPIVYNDEVDSALCVIQPPEIPTKRFLAQLVTEYEGRVMAERVWSCWNCPKRATCMVHSPFSYLHLARPMVVDYVHPVCVNGGRCDRAAREFVATDLVPILASQDL